MRLRETLLSFIFSHLVGAAQKEVLAEGFLQKHSPNKALVSRWQTRHFVLTPATLAYYKKQSGTTFPPPQPMWCGLLTPNGLRARSWPQQTQRPRA